MHLRHGHVLLVFLLATTLACSANDHPDTPAALDEPESTEPAEEVAAAPMSTFINLLPWGKIDFTRGEFPSQDDCNAFVRDLPNYSFYTTPERCEPIVDPVYCTGWQDTDMETPQIDCFRGIGGCEVELKRHDMLAESGSRTISSRCGALSLEDAWARYQQMGQTAAPLPQSVTAPAPP